MTDTLWADISEFNPVGNAEYLKHYRWVAFRSNDGTYTDKHFVANLAWAKKAADAGQLDGFIIYAVYEPDSEAWADRLIKNVGTPHPLMAVMIDVESWGFRIRGDRSADINTGRAKLARWLASAHRVIGYGNAYDLKTLWPHRGDVQLVVADYTANRAFPGKIAHQFTSQATVPGFGHPVDLNSADGYTSAALQATLGLERGPAPADVHPVVKPPAPRFPLKPGQYFGPMLPLWNLKSVSGYFSHNADLKVWQRKAAATGHYLGHIDGHWGPECARATLSIQKQHHLVEDHKLGPVTWAATWK